VGLLQSVVQDRPTDIDATFRLANTLDALGRRVEAEAQYRRVLDLDPTIAVAWLNLGNVLNTRGAWDEATAAYEQAHRLNPSSRQPLVNLAHTKLLLGDYESGWRLYQERWASTAFRGGHNALAGGDARKAWVGQDVRGKRLLVFREQGTGDVIQMLRYEALLRSMGAEVIWRVPAHLLRLVQYSIPSEVVTDSEPLPPHDYIVPVMSLPLFCGTKTIDLIPGANGYLCMDLPRTGSSKPWPLRVGVAWAGSAAHKRDRERSIGIEGMSPLFETPNVEFVNLQFGDREHEGDAYHLRRVDVSDYYDTAEVLGMLDLVIACDTSIVHLAGAMCVPAWVCVTAVPDFRWGLGRSDSPWYRSVAVYRQEKAGEWGTVIAEVREHLTMLSKARTR
jgi:hypothetical protein